MKAYLRSAMTGLFIVALSLVAHAKDLPVGTYQIDSAHSKVGFEVAHLVISTVEGKFKEYGGTIELGKSLASSKVSAIVKIDSIDTGVKDRDDHLKSPDFFDAKKYPEMKFVSRSIKGTPESFQMTGDLTIRGVTKRVTFDGKYLGAVVDGYNNQKVAFEATTKINRKDFGLNWSSIVEAGPVVGDRPLGGQASLDK
jgi:polyisoprenoid-binding protein YceI